jgi:phosphoglucosamine mutase
MSRKYFGTDGVRGRVGEFPITPEFALKLGFAAGRALVEQCPEGSERPAVLIGKDTRISGYLLEAALESGFSAAGVDVCLVGPLPTPGVAYLTRALRLSAGVVISASHNPFEDNGIKFFDANGMKLPDAVEVAIEARLDAPVDCVPSGQLGRARRINDADGRYIEFCKSTFPNSLNLRGLKLVVDCANGAAYQVAPGVFHELGAQVVAIGVAPNGLNINEKIGATHPETLQKAVRKHGADLGLALDGDGDRLIVCGPDGALYDGDQILYAMVADRVRQGQKVAGVVGTLMSNLALERALGRLGVAFERAAVGDRYVVEKLLANGWLLGGENSGHILALDQHTTGDGIIAALALLSAWQRSGKALAELMAEVALYPQKLVNVPMKKGFDWRANAAVQAAVAAVEKALGGRGRVLLRPSGTEPKLRVMVEGEDKVEVTALAAKLAGAVSVAMV